MELPHGGVAPQTKACDYCRVKKRLHQRPSGPSQTRSNPPTNTHAVVAGRLEVVQVAATETEAAKHTIQLGGKKTVDQVNGWNIYMKFPIVKVSRYSRDTAETKH